MKNLIALLATSLIAFSANAQVFTDSTSNKILPFVPPSSADDNIKWVSGHTSVLMFDEAWPTIPLPPMSSCQKVTTIVEYNFEHKTGPSWCHHTIPNCEIADIWRTHITNLNKFIKPTINNTTIMPKFDQYQTGSTVDSGGITWIYETMFYREGTHTFTVCPGQTSIPTRGPMFCPVTSYNHYSQRCQYQKEGPTRVYFKVH